MNFSGNWFWLSNILVFCDNLIKYKYTANIYYYICNYFINDIVSDAQCFQVLSCWLSHDGEYSESRRLFVGGETLLNGTET